MTFKKIRTAQETGEFSGIPYVSTLLNCLLCTWYGYISSKHVPVIVLNSVGVVLEAIYVSMFIKFTDQQQKRKIFGLVVICVVIFGTTVLVSKLAVPPEQRHKVCGFIAASSSVVMYGSPLSIVVKTTEAEAESAATS